MRFPAQYQSVRWARFVCLQSCHWHSTGCRRQSTVSLSSLLSVHTVTSPPSLPSSSALTLSGHVISVALWTSGRRPGLPPRWRSYRVAGRRRAVAPAKCLPSPPSLLGRPSCKSSRCRPGRRAATAARPRHRRDIGWGDHGGRTGDGTSCGTWNWKTSTERSSLKNWWLRAGWTRCRRFSTNIPSTAYHPET